jgi:hypothetical protein
MPVYTGSTKYPYAMTVNAQAGAATVVSENVQPIYVDSFTTYQFTVICKTSATWSSGVTITVNYFNSSNVSVGTVTATQTSMVANNLYTISTTAGTAPAATSYATLTIQFNGSPALTNTLSIVQAGLYNTNNPNLDYEINQNAAFANGTQPWSQSNNSALIGWDWTPLAVGDGNYDSLLISGVVELIGGPAGVPSDIPELIDSNGVGATFRLLAPPSTNSVAFGFQNSYDLGAPQPTSDVVESLLLDGERPFGYRASNRTITLPILIEGTSQAIVQAAREYMMYLIDQQLWKLTWTPASNGLPLVFDCFRAQPTVLSYGFDYNRDPTAGSGGTAYTSMTLTFQAMPYGHSGIDGTKDLAFSSFLINGQASAGAVTMDGYIGAGGNANWQWDTRWSTLNYQFHDFETSTSGTTISTGNLAPTSTDPYVTANASPHTAGTGTAVYSNAHAAHGSLSSLYNSGASAGTAYVEITTTLSAQTAYARASYYLPALPAAATQVSLMQVNNAANTQAVGKVFLNPSGTLNFVTGAGNQYAMAVALPTSQWVRIELSVSPNIVNSAANASATVTWYLGDSTTPQESKTFTGMSIGTGPASAPANFYFGLLSATGNNNYQAYVDDIACGPTQIGPYRTPSATNVSLPGGVGSAVHYMPPRPVKQPYPAAVFARSSLGFNLVGLNSLQWWFGQAYDYDYAYDPTFRSTIVFRWTLTDNANNTLKFSKTFNEVKWSKNASAPTWSRLTVPIPQGNNVFNYANVASYSLAFTNHSSGGTSGFVKMHAWLSGLQALPTTINNNPGTPRANLFNIFGAPGSARSPISVQAQLPSQTGNVVQEFTQVGSWTVPQGVYSVQAECWGAGGAGSSYNTGTNYAGGGGGGGEYAMEPALTVVPGTKIPYFVGAGGVSGELTNTVQSWNSSGIGHWLCPANVSSIQIEVWGGGAAGSAGGGGGGGGEYAKEATLAVTPGKTYQFQVGRAGVPNTGTNTAATVARDGIASWFIGDAVTVRASGGSSPATGGASGGRGGHGSANSTHYSGGTGGASPGSAGGGGAAGAGSSNNGANGAAGVRGTNTGQGAHLTGGVGATGTNGGGNGGAGSSVPGFPGTGITPGGGGGGGYSSNGKNYKGGTGSTGEVKITYQVNLGSPINGGSTAFGASGLTSATVTAHGGTSVANNTASGSAGGTGSSNSTHYNGGQGYPYSNGTGNNGFASQGNSSSAQLAATFNYSTGTGTTTATASSTNGVGVVIVLAAAAVSDLTVSDNAGNIYPAVSNVAIGTGQMYAFATPLAGQVVNGSTVLTISSATAQQYAASWWYMNNAIEVNAANIVTNTGTGTAASLTLGNTDATTTEYNWAFWGNSSTVASTGNSGSGSDETELYTNLGWSISGGALYGAITSTLTPPNTSGRGSTGMSWASSTTWGGISLPLVLANQGAATVSLPTSTTANTFTGTSGTITPRFTFTTFNTGVIVLFVVRPGTSTVTAADVGGNTYTAQVTASNGATTAYMTVLTAPVTHNPGTITVSDTVSQAHILRAFYIPNCTACDTSGTASTNGTTSVTLASGSPTKAGDFTLYTGFTAGGNAVTTSATGGANAFINNTGGAGNLNMQILGLYNIGTAAAATLTASTTASAAIGAAAISLSMPWWGGGGGASANASGHGFPGFDTGGAGYGGGGQGATGAQATSSGIQGGAPGGGGAGAISNAGGIQLGGSGGNGRIRLTYTPPLQAFDNLILHMPGYNSPDTYNPVSPVPVTDPPDGREYTMSSVIPWRNAEFNGTYAVFLANYNWSTSVGTNVTRRITVTVTQYEFLNGPGYSMQVTRLVTPSTDIVNGIISLGNLPLPIKQYDPSNQEPYYTYGVISSESGDRFMDILFLDTTGQTVLINVNNASPGYGKYANYYIDEPDFDTDISPVLGSPQGPERSVSVLDSAVLSGGPFFLTPGDNFILAYSTYGAPNLGVRYNPRWYTDRVKY